MLILKNNVVVKFCLTLLFIFLSFALQLKADTVIKTSGLEIKGKVVEETLEYVIIDTGLSRLRIPRQEIAVVKKAENLSPEEIQGDEEYSEGHFLEALRLYKEALSKEKETERLTEKIKKVEQEIKKRVNEELGAEIKKAHGLIEKRQYQNAEEVIREALNKTSDELLKQKLIEELAYIRLRKAAAFIDAINYTNAELEYLEAIKLAPEYYPAHLGLAELLANNPLKAEQAINEYLLALKYGETSLSGSEKAQINFKIAELYYNRQNYVEASNYYRRVMESEKTDFRKKSQSRLVDCYVKLARELSVNKPQESIILLRSAIELDNKNIEARLLLAENYKRVEKLDLAIEQYEEIIKLEPTTPDVHYQLAICYLEKKLFDLAMQELRKELSITPNHYNALCQLGELYIEAGQVEQAIPYFVRARDHMPEKYRAYLGLGIASWKLGKISDAKDNLQRVLAMNPTHNEALLYLGSIYQDEKNYTAAADLYYTVIDQLQKKPDLTKEERKVLVQTLIKNGEIELALNRPRTAVEHFQKVLTFDPESSEAYFGLGQAFVLLKRYQAAEQNYLEAIKRSPQQPKYYLGLGILYHNFLKYTDKAIENYRKYIQLGGPDKITVNKWIMEIGGEPVPVSD